MFLPSHRNHHFMKYWPIFFSIEILIGMFYFTKLSEIRKKKKFLFQLMKRDNAKLFDQNLFTYLFIFKFDCCCFTCHDWMNLLLIYPSNQWHCNCHCHCHLPSYSTPSHQSISISILHQFTWLLWIVYTVGLWKREKKTTYIFHRKQNDICIQRKWDLFRKFLF